MNNYRIYAALHEEAKEGWVWMPLDSNLTAGLVQIQNPRNGRSITCERRTADDNFREGYNSTKGTVPLPSSGDFIVMNAWYRERLAIFDTQKEMPVDARNAVGWWACYRSFRLHPNPAIRTSMLLAVISLALGVAGFVEGTLSLWKR